MKKLFITAVFIAAWIMTAGAQNIDLSLRGGLNLAHTFGEGIESNIKPGINVGILADIYPFGNFFIQTGLQYSMKGAKSSVKGSIGEYDISYKGDIKVTFHYLEIPAQAGYRFSLPGMSLMIHTGPYFAMGLGSKYKVKAYASAGGHTERESESGNAFGDMFKRGDIGWNFGAGLKLSRIYFGLQYGAGMLTVAKNYGTAHNGNLSFNIGYYF